MEGVWEKLNLASETVVLGRKPPFIAQTGEYWRLSFVMNSLDVWETLWLHPSCIFLPPDLPMPPVTYRCHCCHFRESSSFVGH